MEALKLLLCRYKPTGKIKIRIRVSTAVGGGDVEEEDITDHC